MRDIDCGPGKYCDARDRCQSGAPSATPPPTPSPAPEPATPPDEFHVGPMLYTSIGIGYAHYGETDSGPSPGSFKYDGPGFALPLGIWGVQITRSFALGLGFAFHPFYAAGAGFVKGGFGGLGAVFSPTPSVDVDVIFGGGGLGVSDVFGGVGPAGSVGGAFYVGKVGRLSLGPVVRLTAQGVFVHYPGGNMGTAIHLSPTVGFAGTFR